jgi:uncharacterized repeat protein (TIGR01451 family)
MNISINSARTIRQIFAAIAVFAMVFSPFANVQLAFADVGSIVIGGVSGSGTGPYSAFGTWSSQGGQPCYNNGKGFRYFVEIFEDINTNGQYDDGIDLTLQSINPAPCTGGIFSGNPGNTGASNTSWPANGQTPSPSTFNLESGSHEVCSLLMHINANGNDEVGSTSCLDNPVIVPADVDLSVTKTVVGDTTPDEGGAVSYTITVSNNGTDSATNVVVTDTLEAGLTLTGSNPVAVGTNPYTWNFPSIAAGGSQVITVNALVGVSTGGQILTNTVTVDGEENEGNIANNVATADVTVNVPPVDEPSITIVKQTLPDGDSQSFEFMLDGSVSAFATLSDGQTSLTQEVAAGSHSIEETSIDGWALTGVSCVSDETGPVNFVRGENTITFDVALESDVTCTFTNTKLGTITVIKDVVGDSAESFEFTLDGDAFATLADDESETSGFLAADDYIIVENFDSSDWQMPSINCGLADVAVDDNEVTVTLGVGENVTCTYTNTQVPPPGMGTIIVQKIVKAIDSALNSFHFDLTWDVDGYDLGDGESDSDTLLVDNGPFSVTEDEVAGWDSDVVCQSTEDTEVTNLGIALVDGETVTCVFTNTELPECSNGINDDGREDDAIDSNDPGCDGSDDNDESDPLGSLTIIKEVTGEDASVDQVFNFSVTGQDNFVLAATSAPKFFGDLNDGSYTITESEELSRWELESIQCFSDYGSEDQETEADTDQDSENSSVTVNVDLDEDVTCVFTNEYTPRDSGSNEETITVRKEVTAGSDTDEAFAFNVSWLEENNDFQLTSGTEMESGDLSADELYQIEEINLPSGWSLDDVICSSNLDAEKEFSMDEGENDMELYLNDGEDVVCTFTNDQDRYEVSGQVWHDADEDSVIDGEESVLPGWIVRITNGEGTNLFTETDAEGFYNFNVPEGTWTITEDVQGGWNQTSPVANSGSHIVTFPEVVEEMTLLDSVFNLIIPTAHAAVMGGANGLNFGNIQQPSYSQGSYGGGGNGRNISLRDGGDDSDEDDEPEGQVLGEATSTMPVGAPNTGAGGSASSYSLHGMVAILASRKGVQVSNGK